MIVYHGTGISAETAFRATGGFGDSYQLLAKAKTTESLLDSGFAVISPQSATNLGAVAWQTNLGACTGIRSWELCSDKTFMDSLLTGIATGEFGQLDRGSLHASGFSSGGCPFHYPRPHLANHVCSSTHLARTMSCFPSFCTNQAT